MVFAVEKHGRLELFDDCEGALAISPLLGTDLKNADWLAQMEADFLAGLSGSSSAGRVLSIQRLGGLKLPTSRSALHRVIETGDKDESKWAIFASLRTGDVTVLPRVKELLAVGDHDWPERAISLELQHVTDGTAAPGLIAILDSAPGDLTRTSVLIALGGNLKDPRAVPSLAAHLSDPDRYARYDALDGLKNITKERPVRRHPSGGKEMSSRKYRAAKSGGSKSASLETGSKTRPLRLCSRPPPSPRVRKPPLLPTFTPRQRLANS